MTDEIQEIDLCLLKYLAGEEFDADRLEPVLLRFTVTLHKWLYRLSNAKNVNKPNSFETVISAYTDEAAKPAKGVYITFQRNTDRPRVPQYNPSNKMVYVTFAFDQLQHVCDVLGLIGEKPVLLVYREFPDGHISAELQHGFLP